MSKVFPYLLVFVACQARSLAYAPSSQTNHPIHAARMPGFTVNQNSLSVYPHVSCKRDDMIRSSYESRRQLTVRGGGVNYIPPDAPTGYSKCPISKLTRFLASLYGSAGVALVLLSSVRRLLPIALEPIKASASLSPFQISAYLITCGYFAYAEGYKGFQTKFAPMVVARSLTLQPFQGTPFHHYLLAPFYSMGLFHATKKRMIISWSVTGVIGAIVAIVKRLPYPWRNIIDAGVVVGLSWGAISILAFYLKAQFTGKVPDVDSALP